MFIVTARLNKRRLAAGAAALALFCGAAVTLHGLAAGRSVGAAAPSPASPKGVKTAEDRISYLESYGWQVEAEPISVEELLIPEEFDETYGEYLALQESQGFDLTNAARSAALSSRHCPGARLSSSVSGPMRSRFR